MKYAKFAVVLALFVAMGCSKESPLSEPEAKMVPFTGQFSGKNQVGATVFGVDRCPGALNLAGAGQFAQIGAATVELAHCPLREPVSSNPLTFEVLSGKITLTGANGDEIHITYEGSVTYSGKAVLKGEFLITGGAGRFSGANGNGSFVCEMTGADNNFVGTMKGEISFPRAAGN